MVIMVRTSQILMPKQELCISQNEDVIDFKISMNLP